MSNKVTIKRNTGNFLYEAEFDLADEVVQAILERGCVSELQSGGAISGWEKAIAYPGKDAKRPKGFERNSIPFNEENANKLKQAIMGNEVVVGENEKGETLKVDMGAVNVTVTEYTGAPGVEPKFKAEKELIKLYLFEADGTTVRKLKSGEDRTAASFAASRGIELPTEPWDEDTTFLGAVKAWEKAQAAARAAAQD